MGTSTDVPGPQTDSAAPLMSRLRPAGTCRLAEPARCTWAAVMFGIDGPMTTLSVVSMQAIAVGFGTPTGFQLPGVSQFWLVPLLWTQLTTLAAPLVHTDGNALAGPGVETTTR